MNFNPKITKLLWQDGFPSYFCVLLSIKFYLVLAIYLIVHCVILFKTDNKSQVIPNIFILAFRYWYIDKLADISLLETDLLGAEATSQIHFHYNH